MPAPLPNLYCTPADLYDYLSTEGVELRLDDHRLGTGQVVQVLEDVPLLATTVPVTALLFPILKGDTLHFDGGGTERVVDATLTSTAQKGDVSLAVVALTAPLDQYAQARDSGVNTALGVRLVKACQYGTSRVKLYCTSKYDDSVLVQSWSVNRWAVALAGQWLTRRGGQPSPASVEADAEEALEEMKQVSCGMLRIEDIPTRTAGWPFLSNVTLDISYDWHKVRVETGESEATPTQYAQFIAWNEAVWLEF